MFKKDKIGKFNNDNSVVSTGRRKSSIARVFLKNGSGNFFINRKTYIEFFCLYKYFFIAFEPIIILSLRKKFNAYITVKGGGISGQVGAIRHGIARALVKYEIKFLLKKNVGFSWYKILRKSEHSFLTRDSRTVERKKVGKHKARKSSQFSKR